MTTTENTPATLADLSGTYVIDAAHTRIGFVARHAMVTKVRGAFNEFEGSAVVDATDFAKSSAQLTIQANSIDTRQAQRDEHLRSNDFLGMEEYPQITFVSTSVVKTGPAKADVKGDLTLLGVTKPAVLHLEVVGISKNNQGKPLAGFTGTLDIKRSDFGMTALSGNVGDAVNIILDGEFVGG